MVCDLENLKETQFKDFSKKTICEEYGGSSRFNKFPGIKNEDKISDAGLDSLKETQFKDFNDEIEEEFLLNQSRAPDAKPMIPKKIEVNLF